MTTETRAPPSHPNPYRCGLCRQPGHDRRNCTCTATEATRLREQYNRQRREESVRRARELNERQQELNERQQQLNARAPEPVWRGSEVLTPHSAMWRAEVYSQVVDMQRRLEELTGNGPMRPPPTGPTVRERKIQEILFENAEQIPNGLYKELMDALVIRG